MHEIWINAIVVSYILLYDNKDFKLTFFIYSYGQNCVKCITIKFASVWLYWR